MSIPRPDGVRDVGAGRDLASAITRRPLQTAFLAALGAFTALILIRALAAVGSSLVLIGLAFFLAVGLDPAVRFLGRHKVRRGWATAIVLLTVFSVVGGFISAAVPALVTEAERFSTRLPFYNQQIKDHQGVLGHLDQRFHLLDGLRDAFNRGTGGGGGATLLHVGQAALGAVAAVIVVLVLTAYFLADLPRVTRALVRLWPQVQRERVGHLTEEIFGRVGGFVLGNIATSLIAGMGTFVWLEIFRVPFATLLSAFVALVDLVPVVGSTVGGAVVSLVSLTVSLPVAIATLVFYIVYRQLEDYLITPKIIGRTVDVPPVVTVLAVLIGGALGSVLGALVAIPVAAAVRILLQEVAYPRLEEA
jgi:predicted PurR-regulated permease PerM